MVDDWRPAVSRGGRLRDGPQGTEALEGRGQPPGARADDLRHNAQALIFAPRRGYRDGGGLARRARLSRAPRPRALSLNVTREDVNLVRLSDYQNSSDPELFLRLSWPATSRGSPEPLR